MEERAIRGRGSAGLMLRSLSGATYRFDPGALCLELLTTGGPGPLGAQYEALHSPTDVVEWVGRSRLEPTPEVTVSEAELAAIRRFRDSLWRVALDRAGGPAGGVEAPGPVDIEVINAAAAPPPLQPAIGADGSRVWAGAATGAGTGTRLLATIARDAVELLTGPYAGRIRTCAGERCYLIYVDTSRPGRRRWCSMEHCGNSHKVKALRARRAESPAG